MATATYVGTWRPHRPRGPIGAHFKSPGPKYMLPGSTGYRLHDQRKRQAPCYSFGTRHAKFTNDDSPGPGGYMVPSRITRTGNDGTPKYSLYRRPTDIASFKTPGPGTYSPEKSGRSAYRSAPIYSLSSRTKGHKSDNSPGPAAYGLPKLPGLNMVNARAAPSYTLSGRNNTGSFSEDLSRFCHQPFTNQEILPGPASYNLPSLLGTKVVSMTSSPRYSMTARVTTGSFHEDLRKTPGPGTYRVIEPYMYKDRSPLYSMTGRNMLPSDTTRKPGPGAHSPEKVCINKRQPPRHSFGIRHSDYTAPLIVKSPE